jgi:hypothetical protein
LNEILLDDIKLWIGELLIENKLLQKKIAQIETELKELKIKIGTNYNTQLELGEQENQN